MFCCFVHLKMNIFSPVTRKELELELIQPHMAQKPMLRGEVGARVRVKREGGQRREGRYGRARWCKAPG